MECDNLVVESKARLFLLAPNHGEHLIFQFIADSEVQFHPPEMAPAHTANTARCDTFSPCGLTRTLPREWKSFHTQPQVTFKLHFARRIRLALARLNTCIAWPLDILREGRPVVPIWNVAAAIVQAVPPEP